MKKLLLICLLPVVGIVSADDFIDDIYYTPSLATQRAIEQTIVTPAYPKHIREIVFIEDTVPAPTADTVTAVPLVLP